MMNDVQKRGFLNKIEVLNNLKRFKSTKISVKHRVKDLNVFKTSEKQLIKIKQDYDYKFVRLLEEFDIRPSYIYNELDIIWAILQNKLSEVPQIHIKSYLLNRVVFKNNHIEKLLNKAKYTTGELKWHLLFTQKPKFKGYALSIWAIYMEECKKLADRICYSYNAKNEYEKETIEYISEHIDKLNREIEKKQDELTKYIISMKYAHRISKTDDYKKMLDENNNLFNEREIARVLIEKKNKLVR